MKDDGKGGCSSKDVEIYTSFSKIRNTLKITQFFLLEDLMNKHDFNMGFKISFLLYFSKSQYVYKKYTWDKYSCFHYILFERRPIP